VHDAVLVEPIHGRFGHDHRIEDLAVLDLLHDDDRRAEGEDHVVAALGAEVSGERPDCILHRTHAEHADVGGASHARKREQRYRNASVLAETPHCVFSSEVPDVRDLTPSPNDPPPWPTTHRTSALRASLATHGCA